MRGQQDELQVQGLYRYVRHPMYLFSIPLLVLMPMMTLNLVTLSVLAILYMVVGSYHEESRLLVEFGEGYREYRRCVPRLLPWRGRCYPRGEVRRAESGG